MTVEAPSAEGQTAAAVLALRGETLLTTLERRLAAIHDESLRLGAVRSVLADLDAEEIHDLISRTADALSTAPRRYAALMRILARLLQEDAGIGYDALAEIYRLATERDDVVIKDLILGARAQRRIQLGEEVPLDAEMSSMPVGRRMFLARSLDRNVLGRLVLDPDPRVIRNLLRNPRLTEKDVLRVSSRRPVAGELLTEVFMSERWFRRHPVQRSLVLNPYTPPWISITLVPQLTAQERREVAADHRLAESVRRRAEQLDPAERRLR